MNNGEMKLVAPDGAPVATVGENVKRAHHPERVMHLRQALAKDFEAMKEGWHKDSALSPDDSSFVNQAAVDEHWIYSWRDRCRVAAKSQEQVKENPEAMAEWIAKQRKNIERQEQWKMPLKDVHDLTAWEFKLVGVQCMGTVWLCDRAALCIAEDGCVFLWLRTPTIALIDWVELRWLEVDVWMDGLDLPDFTLGELFQLLKLLRYEKMTALPEPLMAFARGGQEVTAPLTSPVESGFDGDTTKK